MSESLSDSLTIVMVAHGRSDVVRLTLASLAQCEQPPTFAGMYLIENGPPCGMDQVVSEFRDHLKLTHVTLAAPQKSAALNHALQLIGQGWALFIDDDVRVNADWITAYSNAMKTFSEGYYFGGPTAVDYEEPPPEWVIPYLPDSARGMTFPPEMMDCQYPWCFLGFNWAARITHLIEAGGFREDIGPGTIFGAGDESWMQRDLNQIGVKGRIVASATVWHQVPKDRCSADWCLSRCYRSGIIAGFTSAEYEKQFKRHFGDLRCHGRFVYGQLAKIPLGDVLKMNIHGRFWTRVVMNRISGFIEGYRRNESSPAPSRRGSAA